MYELTSALASRFAQAALGHIGREWPNKLDHVLASADDVRSPRALHPAFFGSFDWHSCVHGHWLLARLYRRFPALPERAAIRAALDERLTDANIAGEMAYIARPESRAFERPYGWAWALMLAAELAAHESGEGRAWSNTCEPLGAEFARRFLGYLPLANYPVRAGTHGNSAFALLLAGRYARAVDNPALDAIVGTAARAWYAQDADCQAWEPGQDDFLSPALIEAACLSEVLSRDAFAQWFVRFLPHACDGEPCVLFEPALVSDRSDGKIAHLDGLNLSRAWCWRLILAALEDAAVRSRAGSAIARHLEAALPHVTGYYAGEHWLATFALLALDAVDLP